MKTRISITLAVALALTCAVPGWCASDGASGFTTLKGLAGQWEGKSGIITWKLVSGGSAMMEEMPHESMVSMYHIDDNRLLMTHYCAAQQSPHAQHGADHRGPEPHHGEVDVPGGRQGTNRDFSDDEKTVKTKSKTKTKTRKPETRRERRKKSEGTEDFLGVWFCPALVRNCESIFRADRAFYSATQPQKNLRSLRFFPPFPPCFRISGFVF